MSGVAVRPAPCQACGGRRWRTLERGRVWACRGCGLERDADGASQVTGTGPEGQQVRFTWQRSS